MKQRLLTITSVIILTMSGTTLCNAAGQTASPPGKASQVPQFKAIRLSEKTVTVDQELPGRVSATEVAEIRPQVTGIIMAKLFEQGSRVEQGQPLYQIDSAPYQAAYDSAKADLQKATANLKAVEMRSHRYDKLAKEAVISEQEHEDIQVSFAQARADIAIAKAALAKAKINLDYTQIKAPISGVIGRTHFTKGALATAGQQDPLAVITALDPIYVDITQPSTDLMEMRRQVKNLKDLPITLSYGNGASPLVATGKLLFHEYAVEKTTGSVTLRAEFPNPDGLLLPGLFVRTHIKRSYDSAILIPQYSASRLPNGKLSVWKVGQNNQLEATVITAQKALDGNWLVTDGLHGGDIVVTEGIIRLRPGMTIEPVFDTKTAATDNTKVSKE